MSEIMCQSCDAPATVCVCHEEVGSHVQELAVKQPMCHVHAKQASKALRPLVHAGQLHMWQEPVLSA